MVKAKFSRNRVGAVASRKGFISYRLPLKNLAQRALFYLKQSDVALEVQLVTLQEIAKLNRLYRKKDKPTDVLSFGVSKAMVFSKKGPRPLGEIYLSPEYIKDQGGDIFYLMVHGLLHLLGYDHKKKGDMIKMSRKEKWLMKKLEEK
jgi:probable rRNA maturation factor